MMLNSIGKVKPIIWLIGSVFILINTVCGEQSTVEVTTISVDESLNDFNSSEISLPKVQTRFFNWLMSGLTGQSSDGFNGLGGLLRPGASGSGSGSPFSGLGASLGSGFGTSNGFGMRPLSYAQSQMSRQPMSTPLMGPTPMGPPPMGPPPMGPPPMGPPPMGPPPMGQMPMGPPPGSQFQMGQSQFGSQPPMGSQVGTSNYAGNRQPVNQMNGQMNQLDPMGQMGVATSDPYGDYGGDDFFTQVFTFLFGPSGDSNGGSNRGRENNNGQGGQIGRPSSGSSSGMSSEDWSNYMKMLQTLYSDGGAGGGGAGLGDLSGIIGQATSLIQSFQGS